MKTESELIKALTERALELGAFRANVIPTEEVVTDASFRDACAQNSCGMYGRCWTCPPDAGDIHELPEIFVQKGENSQTVSEPLTATGHTRFTR